MRRLYLYSLILLVAAALSASGATIGQWSGSGRTWNHGDFSTIKALMTSNGHVVTANQAITAPNLSLADVFLIGEPSSTPDAGEMLLLSDWLTSGGILLLLADSSNSGGPALNSITSGLGSSLNWSGSASSNPALSGGIFATTGPPYDIVGQFLSTTPGTAVHGGLGLAGDYLRYQQIGSGYIFAFADRSDHNAFSPSALNTNGRLFLNIVGGEGGSQVPEPSTLLLVAAGLGGIALRRRR